MESGENLSAFDALVDEPRAEAPAETAPSYLRYLVLGAVALGWLLAVYAGIFFLIL